MKVFATACAAFVLSAAFAVFSTLYTHSAIDKTTDILNALPSVIKEAEESKNTPEEILGRIKEAEDIWSKRARTLSFFISHRELDEIDALMVTLRSAAESADSGHYASTLAALKEKLYKLSSSEKLSAVSIF